MDHGRANGMAVLDQGMVDGMRAGFGLALRTQIEVVAHGALKANAHDGVNVADIASNVGMYIVHGVPAFDGEFHR